MFKGLNALNINDVQQSLENVYKQFLDPKRCYITVQVEEGTIDSIQRQFAE